ncbi:MAG: heavy metal sensor histidine kinase [Oceanospirillaceae bacterium]|nr:heavy metal sensor histidine kinase [Oceanospirillaceae bacterium]
MKRKLSLTLRLTLFYFFSSWLVLLVFSGVIILAIQHHFKLQDQQKLQGKLQIINNIISRVTIHNNTNSQLSENLRSALVGHEDLQVLISDSKKTVLYRSQNSTLSSEFVAFEMAIGASKPFHWTRDKQSYFGIIAALAQAQRSIIVVLAFNQNNHDTFMIPFKKTLLSCTLIAALISGILGWLVTRRGLLPLYLIKDKALKVTASQLDQRMPDSDVPIEISGLAVALNQMLERLEYAFTRLTQFSNEIAHELRTPLSNLMIQTQVALSKPRDIDTYRGVLESNVEEYQRLTSMLTDMLFLAKADNSINLVNAEAINLAEEAANLFEFYDALAEGQNISLKLSANHVANTVINGDVSMIRRAISNLLSNAIRHTPKHGSIEIVIGKTLQYTSLSVINSGPDIPSSILSHIFERFYTVAHSDKKHGLTEGTGLGLAITQAIIKAHQGEIVVTSNGGFTCFQLIFREGKQASQ